MALCMGVVSIYYFCTHVVLNKRSNKNTLGGDLFEILHHKLKTMYETQYIFMSKTCLKSYNCNYEHISLNKYIHVVTYNYQ